MSSCQYQIKRHYSPPSNVANTNEVIHQAIIKLVELLTKLYNKYFHL